jgi:hypothetical protein
MDARSPPLRRGWEQIAQRDPKRANHGVGVVAPVAAQQNLAVAAEVDRRPVGAACNRTTALPALAVLGCFGFVDDGVEGFD